MKQALFIDIELYGWCLLLVARTTLWPLSKRKPMVVFRFGTRAISNRKKYKNIFHIGVSAQILPTLFQTNTAKNRQQLSDSDRGLKKVMSST